MKERKHIVLGHVAPPPRPTLIAALLLAGLLSCVFLAALGLVQLWLN
ncbi:hypothetical protein [Roseovarius indicus]